MGALLTEAGHDVCLVNRGLAYVQACNTRGLLVRDGQADRRVQVRAVQHCSQVSLADAPVDLVLVLVKSFHTHEAISAAKPLIGPNTVVLSLQNGLGHEEVLAQVVGQQRVLTGKTYAGGVLLAPGHVLLGTQGKETVIGELCKEAQSQATSPSRASARAQAIAQAFSQAGLATTVSTDIVQTMWEKLLVNVATGALSGITGLDYGRLYAVAELQTCALAAVAEAMAVAKAAGIALLTTDPMQAWHKASLNLPPSFKASMLQSLEIGSVTEVDYINGAVVRWGLRHAVPTPVNNTLVACIKGLEKRLSP